MLAGCGTILQERRKEEGWRALRRLDRERDRWGRKESGDARWWEVENYIQEQESKRFIIWKKKRKYYLAKNVRLTVANLWKANIIRVRGKLMGMRIEVIVENWKMRRN